MNAFLDEHTKQIVIQEVVNLKVVLTPREAEFVKNEIDALVIQTAEIALNSLGWDTVTLSNSDSDKRDLSIVMMENELIYWVTATRFRVVDTMTVNTSTNLLAQPSLATVRTVKF